MLVKQKKNNFGDCPEKFVSPSGSGRRVRYVGKLDPKTGFVDLVESGVDNVYEEIQSYAESVDLNRIVERYYNGEIDILNQVQGVFGDFVAAPQDLAEAMRVSYDAQKQFERLPVDVKASFDNNYYMWLNSFGSGEWFEKMKVDNNNEPVVNEKVGEDKE